MSNKKTIFYGSGHLGAQRGATTILLAFFIMNVLLLISLTAANIMIFDIRMSAEIANSVPAFYAADAGSEWCLYQVRILEAVPCSVAKTLSNGATFNATSGANLVNSAGTYGNIKRDIEVTW
ncbi:MAG: hypothetical protein ABH896_00040 [Candidatus Jacksonbacteria bacterium]